MIPSYYSEIPEFVYNHFFKRNFTPELKLALMNVAYKGRNSPYYQRLSESLQDEGVRFYEKHYLKLVEVDSMKSVFRLQRNIKNLRKLFYQNKITKNNLEEIVEKAFSKVKTNDTFTVKKYVEDIFLSNGKNQNI